MNVADRVSRGIWDLQQVTREEIEERLNQLVKGKALELTPEELAAVCAVVQNISDETYHRAIKSIIAEVK